MLDLTQYVFLLTLSCMQNWQSFATIQDSKGAVLIHSLKIQKEMGMQYIAPKVPIEMVGSNNLSIFNPQLHPTSESSAPTANGDQGLEKSKVV